MNTPFDIAVIGAGIVGLATALKLGERKRLSIVVLETENEVAQHQTGHNSGVIHSGLYYKPGSHRARNCAVGRDMMYRFCEEHAIPHERCGKIVVATRDDELPALAELERRGRENGLTKMVRLDAAGIREHEPHVVGIAGLLVPETGIVDYKIVARKYAELIRLAGHEVRLGQRFLGLGGPAAGTDLVLETTGGPVACRHLINCGGLQSDRVARLCGHDPGLQIVPFRGEYYQLLPAKQGLVKNLIYPVPDSRFPFLGVHFTRTVHGQIEAGPNAVLALAREGYSWGKISPGDLWQLARYRGFWSMAGKFWRTGLGEMHRSLSKAAFHKALSRLIPELKIGDIRPFGAGVRAQALEPNGQLVDDFRFVQTERMIHVLNAPSPAATASLAIGESIAALAEVQFGF
jgi:L-2-hydroxyglutarate oxidase